MSVSKASQQYRDSKTGDKVRAIGTKSFKVVMMQRDMSSRTLAKSLGVKPHYLYSQVSEDFPKKELRMRIEEALRVRIWSSTREYEMRRVLRAQLGFDPNFRPRLEVIATARRCGVPGIYIRMKKSDAIEALYQFLRMQKS